MTPRSKLILSLAALAAATPVIAVPWHAAHAQSQEEQEAEQEAEDHAKQREAQRDARRAAPPSALPGAESQEDETGHASRDLNPTSALFDAINRGSLNAAKEALNRGADMQAHNVLDQTPLDMSIDLNRNDITFLLLSMRTYGPQGGRMSATTSHGDIDTDEEGNGHLSIKGSGRQKAVAVAAGPRFDKSGGRAQPEIGFLGFANR